MVRLEYMRATYSLHNKEHSSEYPYSIQSSQPKHTRPHSGFPARAPRCQTKQSRGEPNGYKWTTRDLMKLALAGGIVYSQAMVSCSLIFISSVFKYGNSGDSARGSECHFQRNST